MKFLLSDIERHNSGLPSGKHTKNYGKIHHFSWENPLFLWSFSIAMLVYQRVNLHFPMVFLWFSYGFPSGPG